MKKISLIGSTGSIGQQTCSVVRRNRDKFSIVSMVANSSYELFLEQIKEFKPLVAVMIDEIAGEKIREFIPKGVKFYTGEEAGIEAIDVGDVAMVAASGFAGLKYSLKAIEINKNLALANKETLVCGGELVMKKVNETGIRLIPVDSEHSALWQALNFNLNASFKKLIITASGGPFYHYTDEQLKDVKAADALKHPTWNMGAKITIDSATMLNKGFEVIEAKWLYNTTIEKIHTIVQPESIIHSMVEFEDGGIMAQLSYPSMELPIQLALTYPNRINCNLKSLDFESLGQIHFLPLERKHFPCYDLALCAIELGANYPCALNGAGEIAVHSFLKNNIPFLAIPEVIKFVLDNTKKTNVESYDSLLETDRNSRNLAINYIHSHY